MVPLFEEGNPEEFFLEWPRKYWPLLVQSVLKALVAFSPISLSHKKIMLRLKSQILMLIKSLTNIIRLDLRKV